MKKLNLIAFITHLFVGAGAVAGGLAAILQPDSPMGMQTEALANSPFDNFLIPGILLFAVIGLGNIFSAVVLKTRSGLKWYVSGVLGAGLVVWILVQCYMLRGVVLLHVIYFLIGCVQCCFAAVFLYKENRFPFNLVKKILHLSLILALSLSFPAVKTEAAASNEFRGVWVSTVLGLDYPSKAGASIEQLKKDAAAILDRAKEIGMTAVILQVRPAGDAFYKSAYFPWSEYLTGVQGKAPDNSFDPLSYWVAEAHKLGLELHAWVNPYRVSHSGKKLTDVSKLSEKNPARLNAGWAVPYKDGGIYYDPGLPEVRELVTNGVAELVTNYDIDGIHLDDYFYPGTDFSDDGTYKKYGGGLSKDDWRRDNVNTLIREIQSLVKNIKPGLRFGIAPSGIWQNSSSTPLGSDTKGMESYKQIYCDSRRWVKEGWIDYICPQIYWNIGYTAADYAKLLSWWVGVCDGTGVDLYTGIAAYKEYEGQAGWNGEIIRQLELNAANKVQGCIFFRFAHLKGTLGNTLKNYYASLK